MPVRHALVIAVPVLVTFLTLPAIGAETASNVISVEVLGIHSSQGTIDCALFGSADGFPDQATKAVKTALGKIENSRAVCEFSQVTPGDYAVSVFHDENSNGKLDRNLIGMPKEGVGASNDAKGHFGPPKFDDARFKYDGGAKSLTIHIQYLF